MSSPFGLFGGSSGATEAQQRLADALPIMVMISGPDGVVRFFNRRWHEFTGQPPFERDEANDWQAYMHPDDGPGVERAWYEAVSRGERVVRMRYRLRHHATGEYRWFSAQAVAFEDAAGNITEWIGAAVDVEDEMTAREALQRTLAEQTAVAEVYQRALLPRELPRIAGLSFDAEYRASTEAGLVGGDWYDATVLRDGRILFSIGDVLGHGLDAAINMGRARQSILAAAANAPEPDEILRRANRVMHMQDVFATALVGIADLDGKTVTLASAGHPPPLVRAARGTARELAMSGIPLGVADELECEPLTLPFHAGETLVAYTDGLTEFERDVASAERRLTAAVERDEGPFDGYAARLRFAVMGTAASPDDVAILALRFG
jgi:PAS domain S-box-containing protein